MSTRTSLQDRTVSTGGMYVRRGGNPDGPVLVLLHGALANGDVWHGVERILEERWSGGWIVPDLPGHGRSPRLSRYSHGRLAAQVADAVLETAPRGVPVHVLGHSLGGAVALTLATGWFGLKVSTVCAIGVKPAWSDHEKMVVAAVAGAPAKVFASRDEAVRHVLTVAAMDDVVDPDSALCDSLVIGDGNQWEAVADPAVLSVGAPDLRGLMASCRAQEIALVAGERDPLCPPAELVRLYPEATVLAGAGHCPHLQNPEFVWPLLDHLLLSALHHSPSAQTLSHS
ncbi:alpha/beta hydrolase [Streptomyces sp. NPDC046909]|uniref:alpha/beta fold hydrolase n=1 Tax=Streptomyces sp. NPDC046909 TaxID=3155617 RepID=UPI00340B2837